MVGPGVPGTSSIRSRSLAAPALFCLKSLGVCLLLPPPCSLMTLMLEVVGSSARSRLNWRRSKRHPVLLRPAAILLSMSSDLILERPRVRRVRALIKLVLDLMRSDNGSNVAFEPTSRCSGVFCSCCSVFWYYDDYYDDGWLLSSEKINEMIFLWDIKFFFRWSKRLTAAGIRCRDIFKKLFLVLLPEKNTVVNIL